MSLDRAKLRWYRNRLASMSAAEVAHRVGEQAKRVRSERSLPEFSYDPTAPLPALPDFRQNLEGLVGAPGVRDGWRGLAERVGAGRFRLLGVEWPAHDRKKRWHFDPVTGGQWPADPYCFKVPYRHAEDLGDVKYVWEVNRLQYLQPMAALAAVEGDAELAAFCRDEIEAWIDANPPYRGVNWPSGIELGTRVVSLITVIACLGDHSFAPALRDKVWRMLAAHGYWLMRYPSRFSSANNHLIAEAAGLFLLGMLAPSLPDARSWADYGYRTLAKEADRQLFADGVGGEQSPTYQAYTMEWLGLCGVVGKSAGRSFPEAYWRRLATAAEFLRWITDTGGRQPRIGDDDEGRVLYSGDETDSYVSSVVGSLATSMGRPDLVPPAVRPHLRQALFGRPSDPPAVPAAAPTGVRRFSPGGYTVVRDRLAGSSVLMVMDHGPLGYLSIAAHGHADALALWLHVDDQPVLVDAGTYLYHSGGAWRDHFRGTPAHNTLTVAGADSSAIAGAFNWLRKAGSEVRAFDGNPAQWSIEADHDGYVEPFGVRHCRTVARVADDSLRVTDGLTGAAGPHEIEIGFVFHPDLGVVGDDYGWLVGAVDGPPLLRVSGEGMLSSTVQRGVETPPRGWYSPSFGIKAPASRLVFRGLLNAGETFSTTLVVKPASKGL